jgi:hypothetical protein
MKLSAGFVTLAFAAFSAVSGAEFEKRTKGINDVTILNYGALIPSSTRPFNVRAQL